jgi:hypothetical protein
MLKGWMDKDGYVCIYSLGSLEIKIRHRRISDCTVRALKLKRPGRSALILPSCVYCIYGTSTRPPGSMVLSPPRPENNSTDATPEYETEAPPVL